MLYSVLYSTLHCVLYYILYSTHCVPYSILYSTLHPNCSTSTPVVFPSLNSTAKCTENRRICRVNWTVLILKTVQLTIFSWQCTLHYTEHWTVTHAIWFFSPNFPKRGVLCFVILAIYQGLIKHQEVGFISVTEVPKLIEVFLDLDGAIKKFILKDKYIKVYLAM